MSKGMAAPPVRERWARTRPGRPFGEADVLQEELWQLGVEVDDRARSWYYVPPGAKGMAAPGAVSGDGPRKSGAKKEWGAW